MEALQMLKFWVKKDRLHFTRQWMTPEKEMVDDDLDDALARLALADENLNDAMVEAIDAIASAEGDTLLEHPELF